ncbi:SPOR domain-containing protein [Cognatilysobacter tabacisoli]|uniref:SPOR domain-containing protein n=1 Tax=Cognatilysobacter tabacisoli TaxID=2315424 RepID=UPI000E6B0B17|nr:SPOR domain-containing protein [Lysobacter tabacisoli]
MWNRALIVLLLVLNVGVAAWWATRVPPPAPAAPAAPIGVARLQLVGEPGAAPPVPSAAPASPIAPAAASVSTGSTGATPAPDATGAAASRCYRYGPFADAAAAAAARARLQPLVQRARASVEPTAAAGSGWRVVLPPLPSLVDAQATAQRLAQEGFDDFLIVREGSEANAIALGRYGREDAARRRAQSLVDAGFAARAEPLGQGAPGHWLDVEPGPAFDAARARAAAGAAVRDADCSALR